MNGDDLQREDVLPTIVPDLENRRLPGIVLFDFRLVLAIDVDEGVLSCEIVLLGLGSSATDLEGSHEGCLQREGLARFGRGRGRGRTLA